MLVAKAPGQHSACDKCYSCKSSVIQFNKMKRRYNLAYSLLEFLGRWELKCSQSICPMPVDSVRRQTQQMARDTTSSQTLMDSGDASSKHRITSFPC